MNAQEIIENWKNQISRFTTVPLEALNYVRGDDSEYKKIPRRIAYLFSYPDWLLAEAEGENGDTARRCLRAAALMSRGGILFSENFAFAKTAGFTLAELLSEGFSDYPLYGCLGCPPAAKSLMESYGDEAAAIITPKFLAEMFSKSKKNIDPETTFDSKALRNVYICYFAAALLMKEGKGDKKAYCEELVRFASLTDHCTAALLIADLSEYDSRFDGIMKKLLCGPDVIETLYRANGLWSKRGNYTLELCRRLDMERYYIYAAIIGKMEKEEEAACETASKSCTELLPWILANALLRGSGKDISPDEDKKKLSLKSISQRIAELLSDSREKDETSVKFNNSLELSKVARPIAMALKNGEEGAKEMLEEYEKSYSYMLSYISDNFCIAAHEGRAAANAFQLIYNEPERAAELIEFKGGISFNRYDADSVFGAFAQLSDYSRKARNIVQAFIKGALHKGDHSSDVIASQLTSHFLRRQKALGTDLVSGAEKLFDMGITVDEYFYCSVLAAIDYYAGREEGFAALPQIIKLYPDKAEKFYFRIKDDAKQAAFWVETLLKKADMGGVELILEMLKSKSKNVRRVVSDVASGREDELRPVLEQAIPKLKGDALAQAKALIKKWDNNKKYGKDFVFATNQLAEEYVSENPNPAAVKKISFIPDNYFEDVRFGDMQGKASKELVRFIISEYLVLDEPYRISVCDKLAAKLYAPDLQAALENIYHFWLDNGADNKTKMIMIPYCIYASDTQILALKKQITVWAEAQRGALGAYVINAIALNGGSTALMMVNDIAAKFSSNMVRKAAKAAFSYAAKALGVPEEVLADRIVPTLGLDKNGERVLDYGARNFTVSLMPDMSIAITDNAKGKAVKSLPKAAAGDDEVKAEEAKKYLSELKKQLKAVSASQKLRLESVFRNGRTWDREAWNSLFADNPVMHRFASSLVWGVYEDGKLTAAFRYADDGSLCDENDEVYELPEKAEISLVHPSELSGESILAWEEQLSDYEIVQPFAQISANIIGIDKEDIGEDNRVIKYNGRTFTVASMNNAAKKYGFVRSSVEDGGGFTGYHIQDKVLGIGVKFGFDDMYMGREYSDTVELTNVYFYRLPENDETPDSYSEYEAISPDGVSGRFVSCCLDILENILD